MAERGLTPKQKRFIAEYLIDLNATQAAIRAGYNASPAVAEQQGFDNLRKPKIAQVIEQALAERAVRTRVTQDRVVYGLALVAESDPDHYVINDQGEVELAEGAPRHAKRAIASIRKKVTHKPREGGEPEVTYDTEIRFWNKTEAYNLLGKHLKMWDEPKKDKDNAGEQNNLYLQLIQIYQSRGITEQKSKALFFDGPQNGHANGHTNGSTNGHSNGHHNGYIIEVDPDDSTGDE